MRGELWIDRPTIKSFVGFLKKDRITWSDDFSVDHLNLKQLAEGKGHQAFVAISITSLDGMPLPESRKMRIVAISHSYNKDMTWEPGHRAVNAGKGPAIVRRVSGRVSIPYMRGRKAIYRNFAFERIKETMAENEVRFSESEPIYDILLEAN